MEKLIIEENFRYLAELEITNGLDVMGLYAIRVKNFSVFEEPFRTELVKRNTTLIYIGKGKNIWKRLNEECRGKSNGTFFRGVGAILKYKPPKDSLCGMQNQNNYRFSPDVKEKIVFWMNENLTFNFVKVSTKLSKTEQDLIKKYRPITKHNPQKSELLAERRKICRDYARCEN